MTPTTRSFSEVRQALLRATSLSQLNKSAQEIQRVGGFDEQNRLGYVFKARAMELKSTY